MTRQQIDKLVSHSGVPEKEHVVEVIETFISWVLVCKKFTYKIKKPVDYSFLDYSSIEKRKIFCLQEFYLNRQLAGDVYVDVLPVTKSDGAHTIGGKGEVEDYAVRMRTMDNNKLMNVLLPYGKITSGQIQAIASSVADFHKRTGIIYVHADFDLTEKFYDLGNQLTFLSKHLSQEAVKDIERSFDLFADLSKQLTPRLIERVNMGFFRDCHGDLHSGNIFLMDNPVIFDRIEFDHELREIDVLNEIAFLCMDLEYFEEPDLSRDFFEAYNSYFPVVLNTLDEQLFLMYKSYRANVCAKVNSIKAQGTLDQGLRLGYLENVRRFLRAMNIYIERVKTNLQQISKEIVAPSNSEKASVPLPR